MEPTAALADYAKRSNFLSESDKEFLNKLITQHLHEVKQVIFQYLPENTFNLYVGGSLARGEPSVRYDKGVQGLKSDVDMIVVAPEKPEFDLSDLEKILQKRFPPFHDTLCFLNSAAIPKLSFALARDCFEGMQYPLHQSYLLTAPTLSPLNYKNILSIVVYQLAGVLFAASNPGGVKVGNLTFWHRNPDYQELKMLLEILRMAAIHFFGALNPTYQSVYLHRHHSQMQSILSEEMIEKHLSYRELWAENRNLPLKFLIPEVLTKTLKMITNTSSTLKMIENLVEKIYPDSDLLDVFAASAIIAYIANASQDNLSEKYGQIAAEKLSLLIGSSVKNYSRTKILQELEAMRALYAQLWWLTFSFSSLQTKSAQT